MVGILILTHGGLAGALLGSARVISGELEGFEALSLDWKDTLDEARVKLDAALERLDEGDGVLILTDIFGATPSNVAFAARDRRPVEVVCGVNLPMVVRLGCLGNRTMSLGELTSWIRHKGRSSICCDADIPSLRRERAGGDGCR